MITSLKFGRAALAGFLGTVAMTLLKYGWPLVGLPSMDVMAALGGVLPFDMSPYVPGALIHIGIGISLALISALFFDSWLPGPGWVRGVIFSFIPSIFAITLLGPTLLFASELFRGKEATVANPCSVSNPCANLSANPCSVTQAKSNPRVLKSRNPWGVGVSPCAAKNPCCAGGTTSSCPSPEAMSLAVHLVSGAVLGAAYKPSGT